MISSFPMMWLTQHRLSGGRDLIKDLDTQFPSEKKVDLVNLEGWKKVYGD